MNTQTIINNLINARNSIQESINEIPVNTNKALVDSLYRLQDKCGEISGGINNIDDTNIDTWDFILNS